ncbi:MAG: hypothetical protein OXF48_05360 [Bacteroidetes bacterium]|nr:hypothetical protein [Bacteroidota bacterium]
MITNKPVKDLKSVEYVEIDLSVMADLDQMADIDTVWGKPKINFFSDRSPIKRFRSHEDFHIFADFIWKKSLFTNESILIHESLKEYLQYELILPPEELALVNYEGLLIIGDTLYSLENASYVKQHITGGVSEMVDLTIMNPSKEIRNYLSRFLQDQEVSRLTDVLILSKSANSAGIQSGCGRPDDFGFSAGTNPARSIANTDMCATDFDYPSIKVNSGDSNFTSNSPGTVLMWNTSYTTWIGSRRGVANTEFFKYKNSNGGYFLDSVSSTDLPSGQSASVSVTVITSRGSSSGHGTLSTWAGISRTRGRGTRSTHSASLGGVSGLPINEQVE